MYKDKPLLHKRQKQYVSRSLRTVSLDVTSKCNMNCSKCYAENFINTKDIELEILKKSIDECYSLGVFHYVLQGGEAITKPDRLEAILKMISVKDTFINVVTNGWAMDRDKIRWLKSLGVDKITVSLDSGIEEEHDSDRKSGSYVNVIKAIDNVMREGLLVAISIVITRNSVYSDGFKKAYELVKNKQIRMDVQIAEPVGKWDGKKEHLITPEDGKYIKQLHINSPVLPNGQKMINRDIYIGKSDHCPAGTEFLSISSDGNLLPCIFLQFSLGNICNKSICQMRNDLLKSDWFNGKQPVCIAGEDLVFIDKFIMPYVGRKKPLNAYKIFNLKKGQKLHAEI